MAKQTGRGCGVKGATAPTMGRYMALATLLALISGCASTWHSPGKSADEAALDDKLCAAEAEETALARAARQKVDYGRTPPGTPPGLNRGETPMQLQERTRTEDTYTREFERCMSTKGYSRERTAAR